MAASQEYVENLANSAREALNVELKGWFDPQSREGQAKIARAAMALRNQNGGFLLVGFDDGTGQPNPAGAPPNPREQFHVDIIQGIASRYASETFEVAVHFVERQNVHFPIIEVEPGFKTPAAARRRSTDANGKVLVEKNRVYVRSLEANGTVSTTEAQWKDWPRLVERCFENREADIARFVRRHFSNLRPEDVRALVEEMLSASGGPEDPTEQSRSLLNKGRERFRLEEEKREVELPPHGALEVSAIVDPPVAGHGVDRTFRQLIGSTNPHYTGWPVWVDSIDFADEEARPYVFEGSWEAFIWDPGRFWPTRHLDFWRIEPEGRFYLYRALQDDLLDPARDIEPMKLLDFGIAILRAAEAIAVAMEFAKAMGADPEGSEVVFAFRWSGLRDRQLASWAEPQRYLSGTRVCRQDEVGCVVRIPLEVPTASIAPYVEAAIRPLLAAFDGFVIGSRVVEDFVERLVNRRL